MRLCPFFVLAALCPLGWPGRSHAGDLAYRVTPLGDLPGGQRASFPYALNDSTQVTGYGADGTHPGTAFLWQPPGGMIGLGWLDPSGGSSGYAINSLGHVAGVSASVPGGQAFVWTPETGMSGLGDLPGGAFYSWAYGINDLDQVVGVSRWADTQDGLEAFLWDPQYGMIGLGDLPGGQRYSVAYDINNAGQVTGFSVSAQVWTGEAFLWDAAGGMRSLGVIPGGGRALIGHAINEGGQITGFAATPGYAYDQAFLWDAQSGFTLLGVPAGEVDWTQGFGLNDRGEVVGIARITSDDIWRAVVWDADRGMRILNDLLDPCTQEPPYGFLNQALGINNAGQIVAYAYYAGEAVLLTPYIPGDLDNDGDVDLYDLTRMLSNFGRTGGASYADGDIEGCDGDVDLRDLTRLLANFGETYPP